MTLLSKPGTIITIDEEPLEILVKKQKEDMMNMDDTECMNTKKQDTSKEGLEMHHTIGSGKVMDPKEMADVDVENEIKMENAMGNENHGGEGRRQQYNVICDSPSHPRV